MADISKITMPSGNTYDLKDAWARTQIAGLSNVTRYIGVTTTVLTDGASTNPITINGESVTAVTGDMTIYTSGSGASAVNKEFLFDGSVWQELGSIDFSNLGDLAYKDTASGSYTPAGTMTDPTISVSSAGTTDSFAQTVATAAPGATAPSNAVTTCAYDALTETLSLYQVGYTTASAKTGDASYSASGTAFTGTADTITVS